MFGKRTMLYAPIPWLTSSLCTLKAIGDRKWWPIKIELRTSENKKKHFVENEGFKKDIYHIQCTVHVFIENGLREYNYRCDRQELWRQEDSEWRNLRARMTFGSRRDLGCTHLLHSSTYTPSRYAYTPWRQDADIVWRNACALSAVTSDH